MKEKGKDLGDDASRACSCGTILLRDTGALRSNYSEALKSCYARGCIILYPFFTFSIVKVYSPHIALAIGRLDMIGKVYLIPATGLRADWPERVPAYSNSMGILDISPRDAFLYPKAYPLFFTT